MLMKVGTVGETMALTYTEELFTPGRLFVELGWGMGAAMVVWGWRAARGEGGGWAINGDSRTGVVWAMGALIGLWVVCDFGCRGLAWLMGWETFTVLTPSRFLTDAVPLMALPGGAAVIWLLSGWGTRRWMGVVVGVALAAVAGVDAWSRLGPLRGHDPVPGDWRRATQWVRENTPKGTVVINGMTVEPSVRQWMGFLTRRRTTYTPVPTSEPIARLPTAEEKVAGATWVVDLRVRKWVNPEVQREVFAAGEVVASRIK